MSVRGFALASAAAILALQSAAAQAEDKKAKEKWETTIVRDKPGPVALKADKAYILVHSPFFVMPLLMKLPSAEQAAAHAAERAEELAKERAKWEKRHAAWVKEMTYLKNTAASVKRPKEPQEPTEENFGFPLYEQTRTVTLGPQNRFNKENGSAFLQEVPPGEYLFYGSGMTCACLGTVSFEAPAGKVVSFEYSVPFAEAHRDSPKEQRPRTPFDLPPGTTNYRLTPSTFADPRLPAGSVIPAAFKPAGTRPNWYGQEVDRVMEIEGVFAYERGKQVDLRAKPPVVAAPAAEVVSAPPAPAETPPAS